jgi:two-component system, NtrC family, response regulator AlgB
MLPVKPQVNPTTPAQLRILVVDDEANIRLLLSMCLETAGHRVVSVSTIDDALEQAARQAFDLIFLDLRLGMQNGMDFIPQLLAENPWTRIIVITAYASVETAVEAMKRGASDYLPKPFEAAQVLHVTRTVAERRQLERKVEALAAAIGERDPEADLPAADPVMVASLDLARRVAQSQANLLIAGEIGTGRGRFAHAIHIWSDRAAGPFATVTCRADSGDALEAELFGPTGKAEFCDTGTLVLDEINELPMRLQPRVLRLLKDREFERHDQTTRRQTNVRIIATTSVDLQQAVSKGLFRADLLLALNVVQIEIPPLRYRPLDLPLLAERYLAHFAKANHRSILGFTEETIYMMSKHRWPGNVRELRNLIERAVLLCRGDYIGVEHLPPNLLNTESNVQIGDLIPLATVEELHVRRVVATARSMRQAATILGIDAGTVVRRMKRYEEGNSTTDQQ